MSALSGATYLMSTTPSPPTDFGAMWNDLGERCGKWRRSLQQGWKAKKTMIVDEISGSNRTARRREEKSFTRTERKGFWHRAQETLCGKEQKDEKGVKVYECRYCCTTKPRRRFPSRWVLPIGCWKHLAPCSPPSTSNEEASPRPCLICIKKALAAQLELKADKPRLHRLPGISHTMVRGHALLVDARAGFCAPA